MMRKKNRILLVIVFFTCFVFGMTADAGGNTEFHVENQTGKAGDIVTVPVEFNTGKEVGGFQISVYYDSETLEFESLKPGDLIVESGGGIFDYNNIEESSEIIIVYAVADTVKDVGSVVDITFVLKQDCNEELPIGIGIDQMVDASEQSNAVTGVVSGVSETFQNQVMQQRGDTTTIVIQESESAFADNEEAAGVTNSMSEAEVQTDNSVRTETDELEETDGLKSHSQSDTAEPVSDKKEKERKDLMQTPVILFAGFLFVIAFGVLAVVLKKESKRSRKNRKSKITFREK